MLIIAAPFIAIALVVLVDLTFGRRHRRALERALDTEARVARGLRMVAYAGRRQPAWKARAYARVA